jgi:uncharacterized protein (DUF983 family)
VEWAAVDLSADDAQRPPADWGQMLRRGMVRRCPRCGSGKLFTTWWSIKDRCPRCGLRFVREEGYFTGVYLVNFGVVLAVLFVVVMAFALYAASNPRSSVVLPLVIGSVIAVVLPIAFYPFARTIWIALDLAMTPMDIEEILEAAEADDAADDDGPTGATGTPGAAGPPDPPA